MGNVQDDSGEFSGRAERLRINKRQKSLYWGCQTQKSIGLAR
jgi:hypothetical protein